jgi:hypothetical protein
MHHEEQEVQEPGLLPWVHIILLDKKLIFKTVSLTKKHPEEQEVQEPGLLPRVHIILLNKKLNCTTVPLTKSTTRRRRCRSRASFPGFISSFWTRN